MAEELRDEVQEGLLPAFQVWPDCEVHDRGLWAEVQDGQAVWVCRAGNGHRISRIGELPARRRLRPYE